MPQNLSDEDFKTPLIQQYGINKFDVFGQFFIWLLLFFSCSLIIAKIVQEVMLMYFNTENIVSVVKANNDFLAFYYLQIPSTIFSFLLPALIFAYLKDKNIKQYTQTNVLFPTYLLILIPLLLYSFYIGMVYPSFFINKYMYWSDWLKSYQDEYKYITDNMMKNISTQNLILCLITVAILPAVCEEFLFRGTLQKMFSEKMNIHIAVLLSSVVFSLIHFDFSGFLPRILLGMFLGYLFYYSGSLWTSIFAHALNNGSQVVFMYLNNKGIYKIDVDNPEMPAIWEILAYSVVFIVLWMIFYHFSQKNKKSNFA